MKTKNLALVPQSFTLLCYETDVYEESQRRYVGSTTCYEIRGRLNLCAAILCAVRLFIQLSLHVVITLRGLDAGSFLYAIYYLVLCRCYSLLRDGLANSLLVKLLDVLLLLGVLIYFILKEKKMKLGSQNFVASLGFNLIWYGKFC